MEISEISDLHLLTELRRDSSFFGGTFGAERGFDRTLAKTEAPTELAQLVIVSRRTLTSPQIMFQMGIPGLISRWRLCMHVPDPVGGGLQTIVVCPCTYPPAPGTNPTSRSRCCRRTSGSQALGASTSMADAGILSGVHCAARHSRERAVAPSRTATARRNPNHFERPHSKVRETAGDEI